MRIKDESLKSVVTFAVKHGKEKASLKYKLPIETINRYIREARKRDIIGDNVLEIDKKPNVLVLDVETLPAVGTFFRTGKQHMPHDSILEPVRLLSYAVKWLFEPEIYSDILTPEEAINRDDKRITQQIWEFVDYADIVIAHNGARFDMPVLNTYFILHDMPPPSPYQIIDTLKVFWKQAKFMSNKQAYLNNVLSLTAKMDNEGIRLWQRCMRGEESALAEMLEYNEHDTIGLEDLYVKIRPWIKSHPNLALYYDDMNERCPNCASEDLSWIQDKYYVTPMNKYSAVRCNECGYVGRSRESALTTMKRSSLISTVAR